MNISDIAVTGQGVLSQKKTAFGANSFLNIGKRGQVVNGTISTVSDRISINFNGVEVAVARPAVQGAREGETRQFKIMDVTKDSIVLKEVGNNSDSGRSRGVTGTSVNAVSYDFSDVVEDSIMTAEAGKQANQNIAVLTGEDYRELESEEGALEQYKDSVLDRAVERMKENLQWKQERMKEYRQLRQDSQESKEKIQALGFLDQKSEEQIAAALESANLPAGQTEVARVASAINMSQVASELTNTAREYIVRNQLAPTIENLYHGQYSGSEGKAAQAVDEVTWEAVRSQVEDILKESGLEGEQNMLHARWLFANQLPVTIESLHTLNGLDQIQQEITPQKVLEQIILAMTGGAMPEQASLDDRLFVVAKDILEDFQSITDQDIIQAVKSATGSLTLEILKQASKSTEEAEMEEERSLPAVITEELPEEQIRAVTAKRQLEEIRLKMTLQSAVRMEEKGINLEVTELEQIVQELREIENTYYMQVSGQTVDASKAGQMNATWGNMLQETIEKTDDIKNAPAMLLGGSIRQQTLLTVKQLHKAAVSATLQMQQYQSDYEKVGTQVRSDLGDSIKKAFANVPQILEELGLEVTQANQRAVRILGYNRMEITSSSVSQVKEYDAKVNDLLDGLKPSVVMELIKGGENPLDIPLDELNQKISQIQMEKETASEEKYSRYLWQLEQNHEISEQERMGYIGIYRLLNNIQKTDGAAIGAVLDSDREMTLGNLLSAVRSKNQQGMDIKVDDEFGGLTDLQYQSMSISDQIEQGFDQNSQSQQNSSGEQAAYYERMLERVLREITPEDIQYMSDGDMEKMLNTSLESMMEQMKISGESPIEKELYQQKAQELRNVIERSREAVEYLEKMDIPPTIANIQAVHLMQTEGNLLAKEMYGRRKVLSEEDQKEYEGIVEGFTESLESKEQIQSQCEQADAYVQKIMQNSYQQDISSNDAARLNQIGRSIHLNSMLVQRQCYDVPVPVGDSVTTLNVTIIQGTGSGKVRITMNEEDNQDFGKVSIEMKCSQKDIKGLILCDRRSGYEALADGKDTLMESLEEQGFSVKNLSYGMDYRAGSETVAEFGEQENKSDTAQLYQLAKCLVKHTVETMQSM